jgi:hypothetical protein
MAMDQFCKPWYVTAAPDGSETCGDQICISCGGGAIVTVQCVTTDSHQYSSGTYQAATSGQPERIELDSGSWITFTSDARTGINYGPASPSGGEITGSWTASDHPLPAGGTS